MPIDTDLEENSSQAMLSIKAARALPYVDLLALLRETNRCPGGTRTIFNLLANARVDRQYKVLEIGSNTGFTSFEIARAANCSVHGIDINPTAVSVAKASLAGEIPRVRDLVSFSVASVYEIPFDNESFDLIVAGGALSFVDDKNTALQEIQRVLKPWAYFSATNLCCTEAPDLDVIAKVSEIIGVRLTANSAHDWMQLYDREPLFQRIYEKVTHLGAQPDSAVEDFVRHFRNKPHLKQYAPEVLNILVERWAEVMHSFNQNHKHLGYIELMYRKTPTQLEPELFVPHAHTLLGEFDL